MHVHHDVEVRVSLQAAEGAGQDPRAALIPFRAVQLTTVPGDVGETAGADLPAEEAAAMDGGVTPPQGGHLLEEAHHIAVLLRSRPVVPTDLVVLAVGVVVA